MEKIFNFLYRIILNKFFRICLVIGIILALVIPHIKKEQIDFEQIDKIIAKIKNDKDINKHLKDNNEIIKKEIIPEEVKKKEEEKREEEKKEEEKKQEETIKEITNIFLKFKLLEDEYKERVKNKKINYKRVAKYGDYVYYESEINFTNMEVKEKPVMHLFTKLDEKDLISRRLVGKKIGEYGKYTQMELLDSLPDEGGGKEAKEQIREKIKEAEEKGETKGLPNTIFYRIKILDFVTKETVIRLNLENK